MLYRYPLRGMVSFFGPFYQQVAPTGGKNPLSTVRPGSPAAAAEGTPGLYRFSRPPQRPVTILRGYEFCAALLTFRDSRALPSPGQAKTAPWRTRTLFP